ncbi:MAG: hypothetical protein AAF531_02510 [Actinomycetota bacterium]
MLAHLVILPCPNGRTATGAYRYSLFLAPRLREIGSLNDYPIWRNWAQRAQNIQFRMFNGNTQTNNLVTVVSPPPDPSVWDAVFGSSPADWNGVNVTPWAFVQRDGADFFSYASHELADKTESLYGALARNGDDLDTAAIDQAVNTADIAGTVSDGAAWFGQIGNGQTPSNQPSEFHQALRYLASHPDLMRRLGLIFDIEVQLPALANPSEMQIRSNYPNLPASGPPVNDFTSRLQVPCRMQIDGDNFPEVRLPDYRTGRWINFDGGKYRVNQGSAPQMVNALGALQRSLNGGSPDAPPAVSEAGITVSNVSVKDMLIDQITHSAQVEADTDLWLRRVNNPATGNPTVPPEVFAEDVAAGTRWDAVDLDKGTWRSLHQRETPDGYVFPRDGNLDITPPADEGWSSMAINTDGTEVYQRLPSVDYPNQEFPPVQGFVDVDTTKWRIDGGIVLWDGWSLSTKRPSQPMNGRGQPTTPDPNLPQATDPAQVAVDYETVPGTLERLRFDHQYRLRGRCVDLCGNSEPPTATTQPSESGPIEFGRTTPVPSPTVVRRFSRPTPGYGDHTTTIVIKSELGQRLNTIKTSDRMLFPARVAQLRLERHGLPEADGIDIADYQFIADRDARTLDDQLLVDPTSGETVAGDAVVGGEVTTGDSKQAALYMPDPATDGVAFHDLPRGSATRSVVMATGNWPDPESVILELAAGNRAPTRRVGDRKVTAYLPQGTIHECTTSSTIDRDWIEHFKWFDAVPNNLQRREGNVIIAGQNVMYSPRETIKLVHAVRVPLASPTLTRFAGSRSTIGETTASVDGTVGLHRDTTDRIVLPVIWDGPDLRTDPSGLTIGTVGGDILTDSVINLSDVPAEATKEEFAGLSLELLDTKRHTVTVSAEAFCRFSEYFYERQELTLAGGTEVTLDARGFDPLSVRVTRTSDGVTIPFEESFSYNAVDGTIKLNTGVLTAQFDYIPLPVSRISEESRNNKIDTFLVPASAAPAPPKLIRALPAFSRTVSETGNRITIVHDGRVVRVHMETPWNDSGEGEQLGVAVESDGSQTQWGRDATVVATGTRRAPTTSNFQKAVSRVRNVDGGFDVAGHTVAYDAARDILTSDVQVNATFAYRPFVQLKLCRYQPEAVSGAHVSTTVTTDQIRLGASRRVVVTRTGARARVQMTGPDNENRVTVTLQEADDTISDEEMKWQDTEISESLGRRGSRRNANFSGIIDIPDNGSARRLIIEDAEPVQRDVDGTLVTEYEVAYREVVEIPDTW